MQDSMPQRSLFIQPSCTVGIRPVVGWCGLAILAVASILTAVRDVRACPFCSAVAQTFGEEIESLEAVVIARMKSPPDEAKESDDSYADLPMATFEVIEVLKGDEYAKIGQEIRTHYFGKKRDPSFLIMGTDSPDIVWASPLPMSDRGIGYVKKVATLPKGPERLKFFLNYLEDEDEMLARDAYDEFAKAPYDHVKALTDSLDHDQVVAWVTDTENVPASRRSLYVTMLGICGTEEDVKLLESYMRSKKREEKSGLNAIIACYLTLRGEAGMETVKSLFLSNKDAEYADTYAAITALRFHGSETEILSSESVLGGLRCMLDRPELADLVIPDLARWEDWSVLPQMLKLFKEADEESNWVRVPIVNYIRACPLPSAEKIMEELKEIDSESVKRASMFLPFAPKKNASQADDKSNSGAGESADLPPIPVPPPDVPATNSSSGQRYGGGLETSATKGVRGSTVLAMTSGGPLPALSKKKAYRMPRTGLAAIAVLALAIFGAVAVLGKQ